MATPDMLALGRVSRSKPQLVPQTGLMPMRIGQSGDLYVNPTVPSKHILADEGSYFVSTNPTPGTGVAYGSAGTQASFSDTVPFMQLINGGSPQDPNCPIVFFDYLKLIQFSGTAPASTTSVQFAAKLDNGVRNSTAGTANNVTPNSVNQNLAGVKAFGQVIYYTGAVATIPAASSLARLVARAQLKGGPTLLLDEYSIASGLVDAPPAGGYLTTVAAYTTRVPPIAVGPGQSLTFYLWFPSGATNPFTYEFELGHFER